MKKSFLAYVGGKHLLADKIIPLIPTHTLYAEVFGGAGWLLFKKPPSKAEVLNDINGELINTYRVIQRHLPISRTIFEDLQNTPIEKLTDIERAARFYYLIRNAFNGKLVGQRFCLGKNRPTRFNRFSFKRDLLEASKRIARVGFENLPYESFICRYDAETTFFYLDPPYYDCEDYYGEGIFNKNDFIKLRDLLGNIKGKFILSINDAPAIRQWFSTFFIAEVDTTYSLSSKPKKVTELLISNYKLVDNNDFVITVV